MSARRKTFPVSELLKRVNHFLLNSYDDDKDKRQGMISLLEGVLMDTGNYKGFGYLSATNMYQHSKNGCSFGVHDEKNADGTSNFDGTDHTRVVYYS